MTDRGRYLRTTRSYLQRATAFVRTGHVTDENELWALLREVQHAAETLVAAFGDEWFESYGVIDGVPQWHPYESILRDAEKLVEDLRARRGDSERLRRAAKLRNIEGRTPEEAEAFLAKAAALSGRAQ